MDYVDGYDEDLAGLLAASDFGPPNEFNVNEAFLKAYIDFLL